MRVVFEMALPIVINLDESPPIGPVDGGATTLLPEAEKSVKVGTDTQCPEGSADTRTQPRVSVADYDRCSTGAKEQTLGAVSVTLDIPLSSTGRVPPKSAERGKSVMVGEYDLNLTWIPTMLESSRRDLPMW